MRSEDRSVVSRPGYGVWVIAAAFVLMAVIMAAVTYSTAASPTEVLWGGAMTLLCLCIGMGALWQALWTAVRADADGVCWRGIFHRMRFAPWNAVVDFYVRQRNPLTMEAVIETRAGTIVMATDWIGLDALKAVVAGRATGAKTREWELLGARPGDASRIFTYDTPANRRDAVLLPATGAIVGGGLLFLLGWSSAGIAEARWAPATAVLVTALLVILMAVIVIGVGLTLIALTRETTLRRRRRERITATPYGIQFQNDERSVSARWQEVTECVLDRLPGGPLDSPRFIVRTRHGDFDFLITLENYFLLKKWVAAKIPDGAVPWRDIGSEVCHMNASRWPGGGHVFHYRTRSNLALLALAAVVSGGAVFLAWDRGLSYVPAAASVVAALWLAWRFRSAAIRVDERGVTHFGPFGVRILPWNSVRWTPPRHDTRDGLKREVVRGTGGRIVFWDTISDVEALREEIRRRTAAG